MGAVSSSVRSLSLVVSLTRTCVFGDSPELGAILRQQHVEEFPFSRDTHTDRLQIGSIYKRKIAEAEINFQRGIEASFS